MKKRSKRFLSILLSAAMVLTMNAAAFGGEQGTLENQVFGGKEFAAMADADNDGFSDPETHPLLWNNDYEGEVNFKKFLFDEHLNFSHYANGKELPLSFNRLGYRYPPISYNVIELEKDKYYLIIGYGMKADNAYLYPTPAGNIPTIPYDGRKVIFNPLAAAKDGSVIFKFDGKLSTGKNPALIADAALIEWDGKTAKEVKGVSVKGATIKNNKFATLSASMIYDENTKSSYLPYADGKSESDLGIINLKLAVKDEAKPLAKMINDKMKTMNFRFGITRFVVTLADREGVTAGRGKDRVVSPDRVEGGKYWPAFTNLYPINVNDKKPDATLGIYLYTRNGKDVYKKVDKNDLVFEKQTAGNETLAVLKEVKGNLEFSSSKWVYDESESEPFIDYYEETYEKETEISSNELPGDFYIICKANVKYYEKPSEGIRFTVEFSSNPIYYFPGAPEQEDWETWEDAADAYQEYLENETEGLSISDGIEGTGSWSLMDDDIYYTVSDGDAHTPDITTDNFSNHRDALVQKFLRDVAERANNSSLQDFEYTTTLSFARKVTFSGTLTELVTEEIPFINYGWYGDDDDFDGAYENLLLTGFRPAFRKRSKADLAKDRYRNKEKYSQGIWKAADNYFVYEE